MDLEIFWPELTQALAQSDGLQGRRSPFDPVLMFEILVIQTANNLPDERTEFLINDRLLFMRFLGLGLSDQVPDARTYLPERIRKAQKARVQFARLRPSRPQSGKIEYFKIRAPPITAPQSS